MPVQPVKTAPSTIVLIGELEERHEEYYAAAGLKPGHILEVTSAGKVQKHATTLKTYPKMVAKEEPLNNGMTVRGAYILDDLVPVHICQPGDVVLLRLAAAAVAVVKGDRLKSAGDGTVAKTTTAGDAIYGIAEEAVDNSGGADEAFLRARIS